MSKPDWSGAKPVGPSKKRKRGPPNEPVAELSADEGSEETDVWRVLANGKEMARRVGDVFLRKPLAEASPEPAASNEPSNHQSSMTSRPPSAQPRQDSDLVKSRTQSRTCDGPGVALLLHKFMDAFREVFNLDKEPGTAHGCCGACRPKALRAFRILENVLLPCAEDLEKVDQHLVGGNIISTSQTTDISPRKHPLSREYLSIFIEDSSE
jgi:hypothetical protein